MKTFIGIDVSKHELVIYANGKDFSIGNDDKSLGQWCKKHDELISDSALFVYEATGGYEKVLSRFLHKNSLAGHRVHANHVRAYAKAIGVLAKTDKIDAKVIADFAQMKSLEAKDVITEHAGLAALVQRREQLIDLHKQENCRLETLDCELVIKDIKAHLKQLKARTDKMEQEIKIYVAAHKDLKELVNRLRTIPGVGFLTAVSVIAYMPERCTIAGKALASLAGLAPMNRDSGKKVGKRKIQGGRAQVRRVLYMAALTAMRYNPDIKVFYERLRGKGKIFKVAITAAMRKLLMMIRSVAIRGYGWQGNSPQPCNA